MKIRALFNSDDWCFSGIAGTRVWARGWITRGSLSLDSQEIADLVGRFVSLERDVSFERVGKLVNDWRGSFAFVSETCKQIVICADIVRSIPVVFARVDGCVAVSDSIDEILQLLNSPGLEIGAAEEYLISGFVYGSRTLFKGIFGIQAGEIVRIGATAIDSHRYFSYASDEYRKEGMQVRQDALSEIDRVTLGAINRMLLTKGKKGKWIVPLSGGYDSRIVVSCLSRLETRDVVCFSYGRAGNRESAISEQVAKALGYEWHFVEYDRSAWRELMDDRASL